MLHQEIDDPLARLGGTRRAFVLADLKILYLSTSKNACTSIKWLMAELAGEDLDGFDPGTSGFTRKEGIHLRNLWQKTPKLNEISTSLRSQIDPANGWYVFGVIRDPRVRMFSAWQNKYLLRSPHYAQWRNEVWFPREPRDARDVIEGFAGFVSMLADEPDHPVFADAHFLNQVVLLEEDSVPYSRIYDTSELSEMQKDLSSHLVGMGHEGKVVLGHSNDTPLRANGSVFEGGVRELVEKIYSEDFARFGDRWDFSQVESRAMDWDASSFRVVQALIDENERVTEFRETVAQLRADKRQIAKRVTALERRVENQRARIRRLQRPVPRGHTLKRRLKTSLPSPVVRTIRRLRHSTTR